MQGHKKIKIFVVQILYRLVRPAHSALHEGKSRRFLLRSNSYFLIQLKFNDFNLCEKFAAATKLKICRVPRRASATAAAHYPAIQNQAECKQYLSLLIVVYCKGH